MSNSTIKLEGLPEDVKKAKEDFESLLTAAPTQGLVKISLPQYHFLKARREDKVGTEDKRIYVVGTSPTCPMQIRPTTIWRRCRRGK